MEVQAWKGMQFLVSLEDEPAAPYKDQYAVANRHFMKTRFLPAFLLLLALPIQAQRLSSNKKAVIASVEAHKAALVTLSDSISALAETAFEEDISSRLLADYAEENGFRVERGVAGIPTAFTATYGSGSPVISVLGEFDALPGISQKARSNF